MAHHDRCRICDYTQAEGSNYAGVAPYSRGAVRKRKAGADYLCAVCSSVIHQTILEDQPDELDTALYVED